MQTRMQSGTSSFERFGVITAAQAHGFSRSPALSPSPELLLLLLQVAGYPLEILQPPVPKRAKR